MPRGSQELGIRISPITSPSAYFRMTNESDLVPMVSSNDFVHAREEIHYDSKGKPYCGRPKAEEGFWSKGMNYLSSAWDSADSDNNNNFIKFYKKNWEAPSLILKQEKPELEQARCRFLVGKSEV